MTILVDRKKNIPGIYFADRQVANGVESFQSNSSLFYSSLAFQDTKYLCMIRSTKHSTKFTNTKKLAQLSLFVAEYRRCAKIMLDLLWENGYKWETKDKNDNTVQHEFSVSKNLLEHPQFIRHQTLTIDTKLSSRVLTCLATQLAGIIGASVEKQRKRLYTQTKLKQEGRVDKRVEKKILQNKPTKPNLDNLN